MDAGLMIAPGDPAAISRLSDALAAALNRLGAPSRPVVFACIGTDRSTGDALGPLVGQKLLRLGMPEEHVIGTLERPLHALNLGERLAPLAGAAPRPLVVAVDAALGTASAVGAIHLRRSGIRPGQGVGKALPEVGEVGVTATVNVAAGLLDTQVLQSTRLFLVQGLADVIGVACWWAVRGAFRAAPQVPAPGAAVAA